MIRTHARHYVEGNRYIWEDETLKIEYSNPMITPYKSYDYVKDENQILYYYYDVAIYSRTAWEPKWVKQAERRTSDFPSIRSLEWMLTTFLDTGYDIYDGYYQVSRDEEEYYTAVQSDLGLSDDSYVVTRLDCPERNLTEFTLSAGVSLDVQGGNPFKTLTVDNLGMEDMQALLETVQKFIQYSIDIYNEEIKEELLNLPGEYTAPKLKKLKAGDVANFELLDGSVEENDYKSHWIYVNKVKENNSDEGYVQLDGDIQLPYTIILTIEILDEKSQKIWTGTE